jgi:hypothetical protein
LWFLLLTQVYCHNSLIINTKRLQGLKYVYLIEGAVFVGACVVVIPLAGITGMLACSIICTAFFTLSYGTSRANRLLGLDQGRYMARWLMPAVKFSLLVLPPGVVLCILTAGAPVLRLAGCAVPIAVIAPIVAIRWCIPPDLMHELISHLPNRMRRPARAIAGSI